MGGFGPGVAKETVEVFDVKNNKFEILPGKIPLAYHHMGFVQVDDKILTLAGVEFGNNWEYQDDIQEYHPTTNSWGISTLKTPINHKIFQAKVFNRP